MKIIYEWNDFSYDWKKKAQKPNEILHAMQIASIRNKCGNNKGHTSLCI